jgi:hypothetical protein
VATTSATARVRSVVPRPGSTVLVTDDGEVVLPGSGDAGTGRALLAGVRHAGWVHIELDGERVVRARFGGATRVPVVREVPAAAALHLAAAGVPTFVSRVRVAA